MNTSIKVILYTSKVLKNGKSPVMLRITKDRKPKYISVGEYLFKHEWDAETDLPVKSHPLHKEIAIKIANKILVSKKTVLGLENDEKNLILLSFVLLLSSNNCSSYPHPHR